MRELKLQYNKRVKDKKIKYGSRIPIPVPDLYKMTVSQLFYEFEVKHLNIEITL